ncbi:hypothetical protein [Streptomyces buecherae]|uniref:hypothetical protein n=1 Tax=Streptomyces buecherae TaxID=2763006 RepID=UPI0035577A70
MDAHVGEVCAQSAFHLGTRGRIKGAALSAQHIVDDGSLHLRLLLRGLVPTFGTVFMLF